MKTICFDFDGVIHAYSKGWHNGMIYDPPVPGVIDAIENLMELGHPVVICSCRPPQQICEWLGRWAPGLETVMLPYTDTLLKWNTDPLFWNSTEAVLVSRIKPSAEIYVDDRAMLFIKDSDDADARVLVARIRFRMGTMAMHSAASQKRHLTVSPGGGTVPGNETEPEKV